MMKWLFFFLCAPAFAQVYDQRNPYLNPLRVLPAGCVAVAHVYRVGREVAPLVEHVYVGVAIENSCVDRSWTSYAIYGASKGRADFRDFVERVAALDPVGLVAGPAAVAALDEAARISREWQTYLANPAFLWSRIAVTPLLGRPCAMAADEVLTRLRPYLQTAGS